MRKLWLCFALVVYSNLVFAQTERRLEYFFDDDPGFGNAKEIPFSSGQQDVTFEIPLNDLTYGFHTLFLRTRGDSGRWSSTYHRRLLVDGIASKAAMVRLEYFVDDDPGYGLGQSISVSNDSTAVFAVDLTGLTTGFHQLYLRGLTENGTWSTTYSKTFLIDQLLHRGAQKVVKVEYFVDNDPGFGNGLPISLPNEGFTFTIPFDDAIPGLRRLYIRAMTEDGVWSTTYQREVLVESLGQVASDIDLVEYFIDVDPGFGNATKVPIAPATTANLNFTADLSALPQGFHELYVRARDTAGHWSTVATRRFYSSSLSGLAQDITSLEYFFDQDPGFGQGVQVPVTPGQNVETKFVADLTQLDSGSHTIYIRAKDALGRWSNVFLSTFDFGNLPEISNFSPTAGVPGSTLVINGFNFSATPDENLVKFNNVPVVLLNASMTSLEVEVPSGYFGPVDISVEVNGVTATASSKFQIIRNQPIIASIEPESAVAGDTVTINGEHFGLNPQDIHISLGEKKAEVIGTTGQTVRFRVPDGIGGTLSLKVAVSGISVEAPSSYTVKPPVSNRLPQITHVPVVTSCLGVDVSVFADVFDQTNQVQRVILYYRTGGSETWSQTNFQRTVDNTYRAVIPAAFITEAGTEYYIQAFDDYQASSSTPMTSILQLDEPLLTSPATDLTPETGMEDLDIPIRFTWRGSPNAVSYDFYIWPSNEIRPSQPTAANLSQMVYIFNNRNIQYGVTYSWQVVSKDACTSLFSEIQEITFRKLPDLVVKSVALPGTALSEDVIEVQWEIENIGEGSTGNTMWYESIYLSQSPNFDVATADFVKGVVREKSLEAGEANAQSTTIQLPRGIAGEFYVFVVIDRNNHLREIEKSNNSGVNASPVQVTMRPTSDLEIGTVVISPRNTFSEQRIAVQWRVDNKGPAKTEADRWFDDIYLSQREEFDPTNSQLLKRLDIREVLQAGDSYIRSDSVTLPRGIGGRYFIYVHTNSLEQVFEPRFNNISRSDSMDVRLLPPPDLTISKIEWRETASNNESISVFWQVENQGPGGIGRSMWIDRVYLSTSADGAGTLVSLGNFSYQGELAPGAKYQQQANILIPQRIKGPYYLVVQTDVQNQVYEHNYEDNNMRVSENSINVLVPDIAVTGVQSPATALSGQPLLVNWTVENMGEGAVVNRSWRETIYLSQSKELSFEAIQLGGINVQNSMIAGSSLSRTLEARLPDGLKGSYYLIVAADPGDQLFEDGRKGNNTLVSGHTVEIELSPWVDLTVTDVEAPVFSMAGRPVELSYTVQNVGDKNAEGAVWTDRVYISMDSTWNPSKVHLLTEINRSQGLTVGGTYSVQTQVTLPLLTKFGNDIHDAYGFIHVLTDAQDAVYEFSDENNNVGSSQAIYLTNPPPVNLRMEQVSSDKRKLKSGESLKVSWSVSNTGNATDVWNAGAWNDGIFLSADSIWDAQDIYVAQQIVNGPILDGGNYQNNLNFRLPNGVFGEFYLLVVADYRNLNNDADLADNFRHLQVLNEQGQPVSQVPITIDLSASPDLVAEEFDTPILAVSGQPITVSWAISNKGDTVTTAHAWADRFYLSTNFVIDGGDRLVGSKVQERSLGMAEVYQDSLQLIIPPDAEGNYVLFLRTDDGNTMYEYGGKSNNMLYRQILVYKADPSDLAITDIDSPDSLVAGDPVTVSYQIRNLGDNIANGYTSEAVYFSKDSLLDVNDIRLGIVEGGINLGPMTEATRSLTAFANNLSPGPYYLLVQADIMNNIHETDKSNNVGQRLGKVEVVVPQLTLGLERVDTLANGLRKYYGIRILDSLAKETLLIELTGSADANNTMYMKHREMPSPIIYDQKYSNPLSGTQEIVVEETLPGDYYILVTGQSKEAESQSIAIKASIVPFELRTVDSSIGGNSGMVTVKLEGAKFTKDMAVSLERSGGMPLQAARLEWKSSILAFASFDLDGAAIGVYDVKLTKADGSTASKQKGFEVVPGVIKGLTVRAGVDHGSGGQSVTKGFVCCDRELDFDGVTAIGDYLPANTRPNRIVSMTFYIENNSNVDIPVLQRYLVSMDGAPLAYTVAELEDNKQEVFLEFREPEGPEHILRPGSRSEITVYSRAVLPLRFQMIE